MKRRLMPRVLAAAGALSLSAIPAAAQDFTISSSAFQDGGWLQQKHAGNNPKNPNCVGQNVSPPFAWTNVPAKATSLALLMFDPEGRRGAGVSHWVAYGIPVSATGFAEGEVSKPSEKYVGGLGTNKQSIYLGPCTPPGPLHHYTFTLIATTHGVKDLPPKLTREEFFEKSADKLLAATGLVGLCKKK
ncbi:MAG: YbhB/YbcL family Raf kinase inhibitor-like protein [Rhizobiales bacterium]|nr:YbhB/YbcL family Raf kinase inhibitor-like protein [Hyphomicrobiales bacterium]